MPVRLLISSCILALGCCFGLAEQPRAADGGKLFARDNLVAWCIVPFDAKKRGPEERAAMLQRLGFKRFAYDWRGEHIATFDAEMEALKKHGIKLEAFWFPADLGKDARTILDLLKRHKLRTQLWVTMGDPAPSAKTQADKVAAAVRVLRPIAEEAGRIGCTVALYNHGGWFGEPENQLAIIEELKLPNVGLVYNLHHGHDHLDRFPALLRKMKPHLLTLNLNGMVKNGDRAGKKILPLGQGDLDLDLLRTIRDSGYRGPIGILGHTQDDAEERLRDNLDGLDYLLPQVDGKPAGPRPKPRTSRTALPSRSDGSGEPSYLAEGRAEYRTPPLTLDCRAKLNRKDNYNILVASDTKQSGAHWELFSMAGTGGLTAYLPGMQPDHVHSECNVCDGRWHHLTMVYEPERVRLYCDGKQVADQAIRSRGKAAVPGALAFGRLVEGGLGCDGSLEWVRLRRGARPVREVPAEMPRADDDTIGLWRLDRPGQPAEDRSKGKNPAKVASAAVPPPGPLPPPGNHLRPVDPRLKAVLLGRSANDAYLAVKVDSEGRLFVGGREALFVFEPNGRGGYGPRRELCRFPPDSILMGLEFRGNDLYVLTAAALYIVPEGRTRREGLKSRRLLWGLPLDLHVSFHCLAWGPEGDLYLNHGDPLLNYGDWSRPDHWGHWTLYAGPEGTKVPYTGVGSVLRLRPDGTRLRVVAGGFRGPVGLAFDRGWNLFTNDNDHESRADLYAPARLMHVTPQADFAWPRGWMASKSPERADLLEPMLATLGRGVPCDLACYDEPYLADVLRDNLLMCRWDRMAVNRYLPRPRGASFETEEQPFLQGEDNARPVGVAVGRGGRVFVTSLYLGGNVVSPYCPSDLVLVTRADDPAGHPFQPYDVATVPAERLWADLSSPSGEHRSRAHQEVLRRGGSLLDEATRRLADVKDGDRALLHLPWLAGASGSAEAKGLLVRLAAHPRAEVRLQAVRVLAEFPRLGVGPDLFVNALADAAPPVQLAALAYFFDADAALPLAAVTKLACSTDTYLRQTSTRLLARRAAVADLRQLAESKDAAMRVAAVLALGIRLTVPPAHEEPPRQVPLFFPEGNAFFHTRLRFADRAGEINLRDLGRVGSYTTAQRWQTVTPTAEQKELFDLLVRSLADAEPGVRLQAAYYLALLHDARIDARVAQVRQETRLQAFTGLPPQPVPRVWVVGPFVDGPKGLEAAHPPERGVIDLTASYPSGSEKLSWHEVEAKAGRMEWLRHSPIQPASRYALFRLNSFNRQMALLLIQAGGAVKLWHNGQLVGQTGQPNGGLQQVLLDLQPGSNDLLLRIQSGGPVELHFRCRERVVASLPEKLDSALLAERLKAAGGPEKIGPEFLAVDWAREVAQGDAVQGRRLFGSLGCIKCHAIPADQRGNGAPSLAEARKRFTVPYLVESILLPSKQVAENFRASVLVTTRGQTLTGLVVSETADDLELLLPDATRQRLRKKDVEERKPTNLSPMPAGLVKTPRELRDLLAYLLADNPTPP
jgi:putative heme-binding domain-containing protein